MTQFKAIEPGVEVNGAAVLSVVEGMGTYRAMALRILKNHGIEDPKKDNWYSQQAWLDSFKEISEKVGTATLRIIGEKIPETALWPPVVKKIDEAEASIDVAYHMNHRNGEIGHYRFEKIGAKSCKVICDNPYPCDFDFGIVKATAQRFAPKGVTPLVRHEDSKHCRKKGGQSCTYHVTW